MTSKTSPSRTIKRRCPENLLSYLRHATEEQAQTLRRAMLHGSRILVVMAGYPGEPIRRDYYKRAHELGVELVVLDSAKHIHLSNDLIKDGTMNLGIALELADDDPSRHRILGAVRANGPFQGVITFIEFGLPLTAWLAGQLGLPGNDYEAVRRGRDKEQTRQKARELGLPTPRFSRIRCVADLPEAARQVGFPAILKPVSGLTSIEVHHIASVEELSRCYQSVMKRLEQGGHGNPELFAMIRDQGHAMILEEFLDGREFDVDFLLCEGECVYASVTDNETHPDWPSVLIRANMPADLSEEENHTLIMETVEWTRQLGYTDGAFHVEVRAGRNGQRFLLEINARLGGASQYQLNKAVWGVDLVEEHLLNCVGIPIRPRVAEEPLESYAASYLPSPRSGTITRTDFLDPIKDSSDKSHLLVCESWVNSGQRVKGEDAGPPDWLGELTIGGKDLVNAKEKLHRLIERIDYSFIATEDDSPTA